MKNLRDMVVYFAMASSSTLGCAFETSGEPSTGLDDPGADQGAEVVQGTPDAALILQERGRALIAQGAMGSWKAYHQAKDLLLKCIEMAPSMDECGRLLALADGPHPGCGLACEETTNSRTTSAPIPTLATPPAPIAPLTRIAPPRPPDVVTLTQTN
jgi:hypothetical protein